MWMYFAEFYVLCNCSVSSSTWRKLARQHSENWHPHINTPCDLRETSRWKISAPRETAKKPGNKILGRIYLRFSVHLIVKFQARSIFSDFSDRVMLLKENSAPVTQYSFIAFQNFAILISIDFSITNHQFVWLSRPRSNLNTICHLTSQTKELRV